MLHKPGSIFQALADCNSATILLSEFSRLASILYAFNSFKMSVLKWLFSLFYVVINVFLVQFYSCLFYEVLCSSIVPYTVWKCFPYMITLCSLGKHLFPALCCITLPQARTRLVLLPPQWSMLTRTFWIKVTCFCIISNHKTVLFVILVVTIKISLINKAFRLMITSLEVAFFMN